MRRSKANQASSFETIWPNKDDGIPISTNRFEVLEVYDVPQSDEEIAEAENPYPSEQVLSQAH